MTKRTRAPRDAGPVPSRPGTGWDDIFGVIAGQDGTGLRQPRDGMGRDGSIFLSRPAKLFQ